MEKLYYTEPYRKIFTARVISCIQAKKGFEIELDCTAFYPEGGGQPADTGRLELVTEQETLEASAGAIVSDVHERDGKIFHYTDQEFPVGAEVRGTIDWERRFTNMQQHSGEHIVSGLIHSTFGYDNVGFHMGKEEMTIDLNGPLTWEQLMEIEMRANQAVWDNLPVEITYPSESELQKIDYRSKKELTGQVRIVEIPKIDTCACCGTHVAFTGEIGLIKFFSMINYKGGVRISMLCGKKALLACERRVNQASVISNLLSAKVEEIVEAVSRQKEELSAEKGKNISLMRQLMDRKAAAFPDSEEILTVFEQDFSSVEVRQFCSLLVEQKKGSIVAVFGQGKDGFSYTMASSCEDMRSLSREMNRALNGRGGGSERMVQGSINASREEAESWFNNLRMKE